MPDSDAIEMRMRMWANVQRPIAVSFDHIPLPRGRFPIADAQSTSERIRQLRIEAVDNQVSANALRWAVSERRYPEAKLAESEELCEPMEPEYMRMNLPEYIEEQKELAAEAKERMNDARRAGARDYDRTKHGQNLGKARQTIEEQHEDFRAMVDPAAVAPRPLRVRVEQHYSNQIVMDAAELLGLELDLAEAQYRWHVAEIRLAEENLARGGR